MAYHNGKVISPHIVCLMWSPSGNPYTAQEVSNMQMYMTGIQQYLSNQGLVGGQEPTIRQYGVWGASFGGSCVEDHATPTHTVNGIPVVGGSAAGRGSIQDEIAHAHTALGLEDYSSQTVIMVFTKNWTLNGMPNGACAFHSSFASNKYWALVPFATGGCADTTKWDSSQRWAAHELFEAAADPDLSGGWYGANTGEEVCDQTGGGASTANWTYPNGFVGPGVWTADNTGQTSDGSQYSPAEVPPVAVVKTTSSTNPINVFTRGPSGDVLWIPGDGTNFGAPQSLGGVTTETPAAFSAGGSTIDVFVRGGDGSLYRNYFDGGMWSGYSWMGGPFVGPPTGAAKSGKRYVFARGNDGGIWLLSDGTGSWVWTALTMPTNVFAISPPQSFDNGFNVSTYFTGTNGHLYRTTIDSFGGPGSWADRGSIVVNRVAVSSTGGNLFANGPVKAGGANPLWQIPRARPSPIWVALSWELRRPERFPPGRSICSPGPAEVRTAPGSWKTSQ
jgi:hypothetical protein